MLNMRKDDAEFEFNRSVRNAGQLVSRLAENLANGDDEVVCDESSAGLITDLLKSVAPILPRLSNLAYVKRGGTQDEDNDA